MASEEAADLLQKTYATVAKGATDYNLKLIEIARTNNRAAFDYAHGRRDTKWRQVVRQDCHPCTRTVP